MKLFPQPLTFEHVKQNIFQYRFTNCLEMEMWYLTRKIFLEYVNDVESGRDTDVCEM